MALEELREKEEELKRMMIYLGDSRLHSDWVRFQVEARKRRQQAEKDRAQKIAKLQERFAILSNIPRHRRGAWLCLC